MVKEDVPSKKLCPVFPVYFLPKVGSIKLFCPRCVLSGWFGVV